jgi:hypothetical protein
MRRSDWTESLSFETITSRIAKALAGSSIPCSAVYPGSIALEGEKGHYREIGIGKVAVKEQKRPSCMK